MSQVQEFQLILHDKHVKGTSLSESFQVVTVIEKLSSSWKDFKNYLKHKCTKIWGIKELILRLKI